VAQLWRAADSGQGVASYTAEPAPGAACALAQNDKKESTMPLTLDVVREDSYWQAAYSRECYYSPPLDYEDYAPAYCVGYIGFAQYGGTFDDAEKSLWANWERIKGDSRLTFEQARLAMRAAWDRLASK
jgi:hypothetical protein